jgi:hypothetical protein
MDTILGFFSFLFSVSFPCRLAFLSFFWRSEPFKDLLDMMLAPSKDRPTAKVLLTWIDDKENQLYRV